MTLEEMQDFLVGKLVRVMNPEGIPCCTGIVEEVREEPGHSAYLVSVMGRHPDEPRDEPRPRNWYIHKENMPHRWHVEVWS